MSGGDNTLTYYTSNNLIGTWGDTSLLQFFYQFKRHTSQISDLGPNTRTILVWKFTKVPKTSTKSIIPISAQHVTLHIQIRWRKLTYAALAQENGFSPFYLVNFVSLVTSSAKLCSCQKSIINIIWLLIFVFDWPIITIGPVGLLLVVPTFFQSPFQFCGVTKK